jgi:rod shape-determining protein MreD
VKRVVGVVSLLLLAPMLQSALAPYLPAAFRPDLTLLVVLGVALYWRNTGTGLVFAAVCGFVVDLLSGGLLGLHALVAVLVFAGSRALSLQVNLVGAFPRMLFVLALTAVHALVVAGLTAFFTPAAGFHVPPLRTLGPLLFANAVVSPAVIAAVAVCVAWIGGDDAPRRLLRLQTRSWPS